MSSGCTATLIHGFGKRSEKATRFEEVRVSKSSVLVQYRADLIASSYGFTVEHDTTRWASLPLDERGVPTVCGRAGRIPKPERDQSVALPFKEVSDPRDPIGKKVCDADPRALGVAYPTGPRLNVFLCRHGTSSPQGVSAIFNGESEASAPAKVAEALALPITIPAMVVADVLFRPPLIAYFMVGCGLSGGCH